MGRETSPFKLGGYMLIPFIEINLDKPRKLRFGMGAVMEFQQITGMGLISAMTNLEPDVAVKMIWVMLREEEKDMTLDRAKKLLEEHYNGNMYDIMELVQQAVNNAFEDKKAKNLKNVKKPTSLPLSKNTNPESAILE
jgi:hypothetical protein